MRSFGPNRLLHADAYITVELCDGGSYVRIARTAAIHPDIATLRASFEGVIAALDSVGRTGRAMLFDTRAPMGRNDPAFDQAMASLRPRIDIGFLRVAVLVRSAVGMLQVRRFVSEDGIERAVGTDERALVEFLRESGRQSTDTPSAQPTPSARSTVTPASATSAIPASAAKTPVASTSSYRGLPPTSARSGRISRPKP